MTRHLNMSDVMKSTHVSQSYSKNKTVQLFHKSHNKSKHVGWSLGLKKERTCVVAGQQYKAV